MHIVNKNTYFLNTKTGEKWFYEAGTDLDEYSPPTDKELKDESTRFNHSNNSYRWHLDKKHAIEMNAADVLIYNYDKDLNVGGSEKYGTELENKITRTLNDLRDKEIGSICLVVGNDENLNTISLSDDLKAKIVLLKDTQEIPLVTNEDKVVKAKGKELKAALINCEIKISEIFAECKKLKLQALKTFRAKSAEETKEQKLFRICAFILWINGLDDDAISDEDKKYCNEVVKEYNFNLSDIIASLDSSFVSQEAIENINNY
ncbi:hypothetical protein [Helicobacter rodentium]|uniref:hypothetical protein n=1 Tax=Helicobacter rodentium TaxID=59617 RepID=UPI00263042EF|nr:hypothetical protein [Helicobacter rodentium]